MDERFAETLCEKRGDRIANLSSNLFDPAIENIVVAETLQSGSFPGRYGSVLLGMAISTVRETRASCC
jgi:hypothetical protein